MRVYAIVPARSGSKGLPDKNIRMLAGKELLAHSVCFAQQLGVDRVICSTDSERYAHVARSYGADVPFLRSPEAASDRAMEEDILADLYRGFDRLAIPHPDIFVWLRPTFPFRDRACVRKCIDALIADPSYSAYRVVTETDSRLYRSEGPLLVPDFDDRGRSMVRRQDSPRRYRVFNTDVFRGVPRNTSSAFLGLNVGFVVAPKICGVDIDDDVDFAIAGSLMTQQEPTAAVPGNETSPTPPPQRGEAAAPRFRRVVPR